MRMLSRTLVAAALTATSTIGSTADAQAFAPVAARYSAAALSTPLQKPTLIRGDDSVYFEYSRLGLGLLGGFGGAFAGGAIGAATASGCRGEYCGLGNVLAGAAIGSVAVATLLSAAPSQGSRCTVEGRQLRALGGSITGALAGGVVGLIGGPLTILTYIVGSGIGAAVGASIC